MKSASFQAVAGPDARVLILGTLPGEVSLKKREYYAQPRNAFWQIMSEMVGAELTLPYAERLRRLVTHRIALWDVCHRAMRPGSADSAIQPATIRPNNIYRFLNAHTAVELICFNGAKASALFRRYVVPTLGRPQWPSGEKCFHRRAQPSRRCPSKRSLNDGGLCCAVSRPKTACSRRRGGIQKRRG